MTLAWSTACALTVAVEVPLAVALAPRDARRRTAWDGLLLNLLTHPLAWLAVRSLGVPLAPVELAVTGVEAAGYRAVTRLAWPRALLVSAACNATTTALGVVLGRLP